MRLGMDKDYKVAFRNCADGSVICIDGREGYYIVTTKRLSDERSLVVNLANGSKYELNHNANCRVIHNAVLVQKSI